MIDLRHGDCLELMKDIPDKSIDMILCDLPYGTTSCKWDIVIPFDKLWEQYNRIIKDNGAIVLFGSEPFSSQLRMSNIKNYKYDWYWLKSRSGNFIQANKRPHKRVEIISVFYKKQPTYNPQKIINPKGEQTRCKYKLAKQKELFVGQVSTSRECSAYSDKYEPNKLLPISLLDFENDKKPLHPTQKPVDLLEYLIKTYTNEGETVLDNCMGSGSCGVAAVKTGRNFIGIELDENYFNIAKNRIEKETRD